MTIPLTTGGGFFTRLGHLGGILGVNTNLTNKDVNDYRGTVVPNKIAQLETDFAASPANQALIDGIFTQLGSYQSAQGSFLGSMRSYAQQLAIKMADQDISLKTKDLKSALQLLISQMVTSADSIKQSVVAVGTQTAVGSPNGNPIIVSSVKDGAGLTLQYTLPETITFKVTGDSQGNSTLGQEPFSANGQAAVGDPLDFLWPAGSGFADTFSAADAIQSNAGGNKLANSGFDTFTVANTPDNWTVVTGAPGTTIFAGGPGAAFAGANCLQLTGDVGGTIITIKQQTNVNAGGTAFKFLPDTQYALNLWLKCSATPAAGVVTVDLVDGSNAVIADDQSVANTVAKSLTAVSTSYVNVNAVFRTPSVLPAAIYLRVRTSTAIDNTKSVFIDHMALNPMKQFGGTQGGGPFFSIFSGSNKLIVGDTWTAGVTNTWGLFAKLCEKCFGMRALGLRIPASGANTVNENLIA